MLPTMYMLTPTIAAAAHRGSVGTATAHRHSDRQNLSSFVQLSLAVEIVRGRCRDQVIGVRLESGLKIDINELARNRFIRPGADRGAGSASDSRVVTGAKSPPAP